MMSLGRVMARVMRMWLPGVVAATILAGLVYVALQQTLRLGAAVDTVYCRRPM